jgi:glycosyltransferase involved in cell wall biosynthesis
VLDGESGLLVPPDDVPALAKAIRGLLVDPDLRHKMGQKARQRVQNDYSLEAVTTRHLKLYREVIGD